MPPKKAGKGKKKKNTGKPAWMNDELWELTQDLPKLVEIVRGDIGDKKGEKKPDKGKAPEKGKDKKDDAAAPAPPPLTLTRAEAALYLWQHLFPNDKKAKVKREEATKLECIEIMVKVIAQPEFQPEMIPCMGCLATLITTEVGREAMLTARPQPLPNLLIALSLGSASLVATTCCVLRVLATAPDTRTRLLKAMKEWSWVPLVKAVSLQHELPQLGGRNAASDAVLALEALSQGPAPNAEAEKGKAPKDKKGGAGGGLSASERALAEMALQSILAADAFKALLQISSDKHSFPQARAAALNTIHHLMRKLPPGTLRAPLQEQGGVPIMVTAMKDELVPRASRANAAGCLWRFMAPDAVAEQDATEVGATIERVMTAAARTPPGTKAAAVEALTEEGEVDKATTAQHGTAHDLEDSAGAADGENFAWEDSMLDDETKRVVMERVSVVVEALAVPALLALCVGPEGPLPDLATTPPPSAEGKKKPKKKSKKKAKLEPGVAEAQTYATACLRLISLGDRGKEAVVAAGGVRYLTPLLESRMHRPRWNARQALLNMAMLPDHVPVMTMYTVPAYIHGANIPRTHYERPGTVPAPPGAANADIAAAAAAAGPPRPLSVPPPPGKSAATRLSQAPAEIAAAGKLASAALTEAVA